LRLSPFASLVAILASAVLVGCPKESPVPATTADAAVSVVTTPAASASAPAPAATEISAMEAALQADASSGDLRIQGNQRVQLDPNSLAGLAARYDKPTDAGKHLK
jgi:hypothetical protein